MSLGLALPRQPAASVLPAPHPPPPGLLSFPSPAFFLSAALDVLTGFFGGTDTSARAESAPSGWLLTPWKRTGLKHPFLETTLAADAKACYTQCRPSRPGDGGDRACPERLALESLDLRAPPACVRGLTPPLCTAQQDEHSEVKPEAICPGSLRAPSSDTGSPSLGSEQESSPSGNTRQALTFGGPPKEEEMVCWNPHVGTEWLTFNCWYVSGNYGMGSGGAGGECGA